MKKIKLILIAVTACFFMASCNDESGTYVNQLYTNAQKEGAVKSCLTQSKDSVLNHLFENNGFYNYDNGYYRIDFNQSIFDTLSAYNLGYLKDTLVVLTNRLASSCYANMSEALTNAINGMVYWNPDSLIYGGTNAITNYFKMCKKDELKAAMQSPVSIRMNVYNVTETWNTILNQYRNICNVPVSIDLQNNIIDQMLNAVFEEMSIEEYNIRTDTTHQDEYTKIFRQ